jgi:phosphatidylserine/phosphatidylglycerophosphate/cardiolipin synthase-like enzyme
VPLPQSVGGRESAPEQALPCDQAIRGARRSLDIAIYSFTDLFLAEAVREAGRRGLRVRIYRDGDEYEREVSQALRHRSAMEILRGQANTASSLPSTFYWQAAVTRLAHLRRTDYQGASARFAPAEHWDLQGYDCSPCEQHPALLTAGCTYCCWLSTR